MNSFSYDVIVVGGGIIGTATAMTLLKQKPRTKLLLIEAEKKLAPHQTGNNSGVIHSGLYYKPGSLKAQNCILGRELLQIFCDQNDIKYEKCGKIVVAIDNSQLAQLESLYQRGIENGLQGIKKINISEIKEYEPHAAGIAGLFVPQTGIVDYKEVTNAYAKQIISLEGKILTDAKLEKVISSSSETILQTTRGDFKTKLLINCGGLYSDRIAKLCGLNPGIIIAPFRGEYKILNNEKEFLVKNLIYPVPDPAFPFLGVHFTRRISGGVEAGPNAVPAFKRVGYSYGEISLTDMTEMLFYPGFIKMASKYASMGIGEIYRSLNNSAFTKALQKLVPEIQTADMKKGGAGVRAQALSKAGKLIDDFVIEETKNSIHVLNAPSPAATASLSIAKVICSLIEKKISM